MTDESLLNDIKNYMRNATVGSLEHTFETYCERNGIRKYDGRMKDNDDTYQIGREGAARVECVIYGKSKGEDRAIDRETKLQIVLRKIGGEYLIITDKRIGVEKRAVEVMMPDKVLNYQPERVRALMRAYKGLFDMMEIEEPDENDHPSTYGQEAKVVG